VEAFMDHTDQKQDIKKMRQCNPALNGNWGTLCTPLQIPAPHVKIRETNCADTEGIFRIVHFKEGTVNRHRAWKNHGSWTVIGEVERMKDLNISSVNASDYELMSLKWI
jgi:hypothetical protein